MNEDRLVELLRSFKAEMPQLKDVYVLENTGLSLDEQLVAYYTNLYKGGITVFVEFFDAMKIGSNRVNIWRQECQLVVLQKASRVDKKSVSVARMATKAVAIELSNRLIEAADDARLTGEPWGVHFASKMLQVTRAGNQEIFGWLLDLDIDMDVSG